MLGTHHAKLTLRYSMEEDFTSAWPVDAILIGSIESIEKPLVEKFLLHPAHDKLVLLGLI
jgi:hypothetical protein